MASMLQVGMVGEKGQWFNEEGSKKVTWKEVPQGEGPPVTWYKVMCSLIDAKCLRILYWVLT